MPSQQLEQTMNFINQSLENLNGAESILLLNTIFAEYSRKIRNWLFVIDIFSKYAWVVPLKNKKGIPTDSWFLSIVDI